MGVQNEKVFHRLCFGFSRACSASVGLMGAILLVGGLILISMGGAPKTWIGD
jgi:hypothetical protein